MPCIKRDRRVDNLRSWVLYNTCVCRLPMCCISLHCNSIVAVARIHTCFYRLLSDKMTCRLANGTPTDSGSSSKLMSNAHAYRPQKYIQTNMEWEKDEEVNTNNSSEYIEKAAAIMYSIHLCVFGSSLCLWHKILANVDCALGSGILFRRIVVFFHNAKT